MDMEEAHRRDNYYSFAMHMPGLQDPKAWVLDAEYDALPPFVFTVGGDDFSAAQFKRYIEMVQQGKMCAYDAAQGYFDAVSG